MNRYMLGSIDAKPDAIAANLKNRDLDIIGNYDFLIFLPTDDKHLTRPFSKFLLKLKNTDEA